MEFTMELTASVFANVTSNRRKPCKSSDEQIALHLRYAKIGFRPSRPPRAIRAVPKILRSGRSASSRRCELP
jgi:hypothetical protein